ncbi:putative WRKY transcription factor 57-like isoform X1 [Hibiscus syriacus]|uniref:WRKY transcription factor 57-like isoform X1 n=1 Tax=Hibiscus syriacus TaxID=106335 RepID=A0A6A2WVB5_HIBSY|nr:zinc finger protein ZAT9-like [Hibiscus syriacus]KAE8653716.1 putative WRKY transcription factor 57-like isoform X1 [Hibiscus syriacus]
MEQTREKKFVCKFCNKRYPCGKSLGGHIRTHMNNENCGESETVPSAGLICNGRIVKRVAEAEADGYGLRENPKKTKKFSVSSNAPLLKEMICKECGKGFHSSKALCGHMACHSEKERVYCEKQKPMMDSQSDTETSSTPSKRRRSKRIRYRSTEVYSNNSVVMENGSSSVSGIEQEQEEVAMCLMMLSRDSSGCCKKGLSSIGDSSDNNSVILEAKSSSIDVRITVKNDMKCVPNNGEYLKMKQRDTKLKSAEAGPSSECSDSFYFTNGPKKVEFEEFDSKFGKSSSKFKSLNTEFPKDNNQANRGLNQYDLRRSNARNDDYYSHEVYCNNPSKGSKYECLTCNKAFDSHRALRGHRANHTKANDCNEDSLANDGFIVPMTHNKVTKPSPHGRTLNNPLGSSSEKRLGSKKNKRHQCPFCFRVFKSGQALGGHKRSHFVGGAEDRTLVIKQDSPDMPTAAVIDLNLPAPVEDDAMGNVGISPWEI